MHCSRKIYPTTRERCFSFWVWESSSPPRNPGSALCFFFSTFGFLHPPSTRNYTYARAPTGVRNKIQGDFIWKQWNHFVTEIKQYLYKILSLPLFLIQRYINQGLLRAPKQYIHQIWGKWIHLLQLKTLFFWPTSNYISCGLHVVGFRQSNSSPISRVG